MWCLLMNFLTPIFIYRWSTAIKVIQVQFHKVRSTLELQRDFNHVAGGVDIADFFVFNIRHELLPARFSFCRSGRAVKAPKSLIFVSWSFAIFDTAVVEDSFDSAFNAIR